MARKAIHRRHKAASKKSVGNTPKARQLDGGACALAGYTYQMLASGALGVQLCTLGTQPASEAIVLLEQHGQDAKVPGALARLVQFKYSETRKPITPGDLADVLRSLDKSSKELSSPTAADWQLVTNRPLSADAQKLLKAAKRDTRTSRLPRTKASDANKRRIRALGHRLALEHYDVGDLRDVLVKEAAKRGEDDGDAVIDRVVALMYRIAQRSPAHRRVSQRDLHAALAGHANSQSIHLDDCRDSQKAALATAARKQGTEIDLTISRTRLRAIFGEPSTALAVVHGPGGCGKTISLLKALHDRLTERQGLAGLVDGREKSPQALVADWRGARNIDVSLAEALHRVSTANREVARPVVIFGLDGFDEAPESERGPAQRLIQSFFDLHVDARASSQDAAALLVVTCRSEQEFKRVIDPVSPGGPSLAEVPSIQIDEFDDDELAAVWRLWFSGEDMPSSLLSRSRVATFADGTGSNGTPPPIARALRLPIFLACVRTLDSGRRRRLYGGDTTVLPPVLIEYCKWFARKAAQRTSCDEDLVFAVLKAASRATAANKAAGTYNVEAHWVEPAARATDRSKYLMKQLFVDAIRAGVVFAGDQPYSALGTKSVEWTWRIPELAMHLASLD